MDNTKQSNWVYSNDSTIIFSEMKDEKCDSRDFENCVQFVRRF